MNKVIFFIILTISLQANAQIPSYVPTTGLIGYWPFSGNANDVSGNGHNGTVNGATLSTDRRGNSNSAYLFNGTSDNIFVPSTGIMNVTRTTVSAWVKYIGNADLQKTFDTYFKFGNGTNHSLGYSYDFTNQNFNLFQKCKGAIMTLSNLNNAWHNIIIVQDSILSKLYLDGVKIDSINYTSGTCYGGTNNLVFGADPDDAQWMTGYLDDIGFWNRALTQAEITLLFQSIPAGIETTTNQKIYKIYPSPIQDFVTIEISDELLGSQFSIKDLFGRIMKTGELKSIINIIDLNELNPGVYLVTLGREKHETIKIFKK